MGGALSSEKRTQLLSSAALTAGAAAVWWLTSSRGRAVLCDLLQPERDGEAAAKEGGGRAGGTGKRGGGGPLNERMTEKVMREMCEAFFPIFTEFAQVTRSVAQAVEGQTGLPQENIPTKEQVEAMLMEQVFRESLAAAETAVLQRNGVSRDKLEAACNRYQTQNAPIALYVAGLKKMYEDAVNGDLPLLPTAALPAEATQELLLAALQQIHEVKRQKFSLLLQQAQLSDLKTPGPAMTRKLQTCSKHAEQQVLAMPAYSSLLNEQLLLHAVALYSRDHTFRIKKQLLDEMHAEHVMAMMERRKKELKEGRVYTPENDCVVAALHPKLEEIAAGELLPRLQRAHASRAAIALLVLRGNSKRRTEEEGAAAAAEGRGDRSRRGEGDEKKEEEWRSSEGSNEEEDQEAFFFRMLERSTKKPTAAAAAGAGGAGGRRGGGGGGAGEERGRREESGEEGGSCLRPLNDFCESIDVMDDTALSFLCLDHAEAKHVPLATLQQAARNAERAGAAFLLFRGAELLKETCLLGELLSAVEEMKKQWKAERAAVAAASVSASATPAATVGGDSAAAAAAAVGISPAGAAATTDASTAAAAVTSTPPGAATPSTGAAAAWEDAVVLATAVDIPLSCPLRDDGALLNASFASTVAAVADIAAEVDLAAAAVLPAAAAASTDTAAKPRIAGVDAAGRDAAAAAGKDAAAGAVATPSASAAAGKDAAAAAVHTPAASVASGRDGGSAVDTPAASAGVGRDAAISTPVARGTGSTPTIVAALLSATTAVVREEAAFSAAAFPTNDTGAAAEKEAVPAAAGITHSADSTVSFSPTGVSTTRRQDVGDETHLPSTKMSVLGKCAG